MEETQQNIHQTKRKTSCCYWFCCEFSEQDLSREKSQKISRSDGNRKSHHSISWLSSIWPMKKSGTKTVPFDSTSCTVPDETEMKCKSSLKSKLKRKFYCKRPVDQVEAITEVAKDHQAPRVKPHETRHNKNSDHSDCKDATCQNGSSEVKTRVNFPNSENQLQNRRVNPRAHSQVTLLKKKAIVVKKLDAVVGISIIVVTLITMLLWGQLCAIFCTCAWLYYIPRYRKVTEIVDDRDRDKLDSGSGHLDLDSVEHKKKVVLEGFLKRSHPVIL
ncbi:hypothetical protein CFOL_v3_04521 [Cephalotus follicularis]|uniref:Uncharacterized protein n=1 Tax=Cephalotus follicularis TaxID=3775 RepID=A0A1Q3AZM4_CEPFO|nr:hypothetical protein CFOL_v3_04521 [Cephalotus follicularis]